jgi:hypothetical protein
MVYFKSSDNCLSGKSHTNEDWEVAIREIINGNYNSKSVSYFYNANTLCIHPDYKESFKNVIEINSNDILYYLFNNCRLSIYYQDYDSRGTFQLFLCAVIHVNSSLFLDTIKKFYEMLFFTSDNNNNLEHVCGYEFQFINDFIPIIINVINNSFKYHSNVIENTICKLYMIWASFNFVRGRPLIFFDLNQEIVCDIAIRNDCSESFLIIFMKNPGLFKKLLTNWKLDIDRKLILKLESIVDICFSFGTRKKEKHWQDEKKEVDRLIKSHKQRLL